MSVLLDTHILLGLMRQATGRADSPLPEPLDAAPTIAHASVASLWEIAIKARLGKLDPGMALDDMAGFLEAVGLTLLPIDRRHAVAWVEPEPATRDPFDRMLLAQCAVEGLRLVTRDRALAVHPLAWRPR